MSDAFRVNGIDHVELFVPDRREAAAWYQRVLGLEVLREFESWADDAGGPLMIACADGRSKLALFEGPALGSRDPTGIRRIAFAVDGAVFLRFLERLDALELKDARGTRVTRQRVVDHDGAMSIYFTDPWGTPLELTSYDPGPIRAALAAPAR